MDELIPFVTRKVRKIQINFIHIICLSLEFPLGHDDLVEIEFVVIDYE
jgi:hypothetical protein